MGNNKNQTEATIKKVPDLKNLIQQEATPHDKRVTKNFIEVKLDNSGKKAGYLNGKHFVVLDELDDSVDLGFYIGEEKSRFKDKNGVNRAVYSLSSCLLPGEREIRTFVEYLNEAQTDVEMQTEIAKELKKDAPRRYNKNPDIEEYFSLVETETPMEEGRARIAVRSMLNLWKNLSIQRIEEKLPYIQQY